MTIVVDASAIGAILFGEPVPARDIAELALQTDLSAYDASYLWLAISRDAELVTLDRKLADANDRLR